MSGVFRQSMIRACRRLTISLLDSVKQRLDIALHADIPSHRQRQSIILVIGPRSLLTHLSGLFQLFLTSTGEDDPPLTRLGECDGGYATDTGGGSRDACDTF